MSDYIYNGTRQDIPNTSQVEVITNSITAGLGVPTWSEIKDKFGSFKTVNSAKSDLINLLSLKFNASATCDALDKVTNMLDTVDLLLDEFSQIDTEVVTPKIDVSQVKVDSIISAFSDYHSYDELVADNPNNYTHTIKFSIMRGSQVSLDFAYVNNNIDREWITLQSNTDLATIFYIYRTGSQQPWQLYASDISNAFKAADGQFVSIDGLMSDVANQISNNAVILMLTEEVPLHGTKSLDYVQSRLSEYDSETAELAKTTLSSFDSFSAKSCLTTVYTIISRNSSAEYNEGDEYYTPLERPGFTSNYVFAVVQLALQGLAAIFTIIFHTVGIILYVVGQLFNTIFQGISKLLDQKYTATADRLSSQPVFNYPLTVGITFTKSQLENMFDNETDLANYLENEVVNSGCAAVYPEDQKYVMLVLPKTWDDETNTFSEYYVQWLSPASKPTESYKDSCDYAREGGSYETILDVTEWDKIITYSNQFNDVDYVSMTDDDFLRSAAHSAISILQRSVESIGRISGYAEIKTQAGDRPTKLHDMIPVVKGYKNVGYYTNDGVLYLTDDQKRQAIINLVVYWFWHAVKIGLDPNRDLTWGDVVTLYDWIRDNISVSALHGYNNLFISTDVGSGSELLNPSVSFPVGDKAALVFALITTAVAAAGVVATTVLVKQTLKKRATLRLMRREAEFKRATDEYQKDPKNKVLAKKANKANKKLARAWSFAGAVGLKSYNGFSCSSPTIPNGSIEFSTLGESTSNNLPNTLNDVYPNTSTVVDLIASS